MYSPERRSEVQCVAEWYAQQQIVTRPLDALATFEGMGEVNEPVNSRTHGLPRSRSSANLWGHTARPSQGQEEAQGAISIRQLLAGTSKGSDGGEVREGIFKPYDLQPS